jgi:hypothetical protein
LTYFEKSVIIGLFKVGYLFSTGERIMRYKIYVHVENCGDGSVSIQFHKSEKDAEESYASVEGTEYGFAEDAISSVELEVRDGELYLCKDEYRKGKWVEVLEEVLPFEEK